MTLLFLRHWRVDDICDQIGFISIMPLYHDSRRFYWVHCRRSNALKQFSAAPSPNDCILVGRPRGAEQVLQGTSGIVQVYQPPHLMKHTSARRLIAQSTSTSTSTSMFTKEPVLVLVPVSVLVSSIKYQ